MGELCGDCGWVGVVINRNWLLGGEGGEKGLMFFFGGG